MSDARGRRRGLPARLAAAVFCAAAIPVAGVANDLLADRLVVRWVDEAFRLQGVAPVPRKLPPADLVLPVGEGPRTRTATAVSGFWYELRSCAGTVLFRQALPDPRRATVEWLEIGVDGSMRIARAEAVRPEALFTVTVPRHPEGCEVVFLGAPYRSGRARASARELGRLEWRGPP